MRASLQKVYAESPGQLDRPQVKFPFAFGIVRRRNRRRRV